MTSEPDGQMELRERRMTIMRRERERETDREREREREREEELKK
jgi:hypothetical protein